MRLLALLCACSGCDWVIPLTEPVDAACGPYKSITPVVFAETLQEHDDFSIHYDGVHGMVHARVQVPAMPAMTYTGPVPIVMDDTGTWQIDVPRFTNINAFRLDGGHVLGDGSVFGWRDRISNPSTPPTLIRFTFSTMWSQETSGQALDDSAKNMRPGNEIVLDVGNGGLLRFFPQIRLDNGEGKNQLVIRQKFVNENWLTTDQADTITRLESLNPSAAVMTADHKVLLVAASDSGAKQRIYASERDPQLDEFAIGRPVELDSDGELDDTQPWIGESCATLYFRRGGVTYRAQ